MQTNALTELETQLMSSPMTWCITGCAGFIGSNLLLRLLSMDQKVIGLDDLSSGSLTNLDSVKSHVTETQWQRFNFMQGDIRDATLCQQACDGVDYVLHHAAVASVQDSIQDPAGTFAVNVDGTFNMLLAAKDAKCKAFIYASSSAIYGDDPSLPKRESQTPQCLSPYASYKLMNEQMAAMFAGQYQLACVGLRYFNIYGPRQNPQSEYGAVIPCWIKAVKNNCPITIFGDGENTRDFCFVDDVVSANLLAANYANPGHAEIYNIGTGTQTSLNYLAKSIQDTIVECYPDTTILADIHYHAKRVGDVQYSFADISHSKQALNYQPTVALTNGLMKIIQFNQSGENEKQDD